MPEPIFDGSDPVVCDDCGQLITGSGAAEPAKIESHRLWWHPTKLDFAIAREGVQLRYDLIQLMFADGDWMNAGFALSDLTELIARLKKYAFALAEEELIA